MATSTSTRDHHCRLHVGHDFGEPRGLRARCSCQPARETPAASSACNCSPPSPPCCFTCCSTRWPRSKALPPFPGEQIMFPVLAFCAACSGAINSSGDANLFFKLESQSKRSRDALCPGFGGRLCGRGCSQLVSGSCFWLPGNGLAYGCGEPGAGGPGRPAAFGKQGVPV